MTDHEGVPRAPHGEISERDAEIYRYAVVNRWVHSKIAEHFKISRERVGQILARVRETLPPLDVAAIRQESLELNRDIMRRALELAEMEGAPVTAGKDGDVVRDPENAAVVREYSGRVMALRLAQAADKEIRVLTGADAATKVESTATVRYEVTGVNLDALK